MKLRKFRQTIFAHLLKIGLSIKFIELNSMNIKLKVLNIMPFGLLDLLLKKTE
jgi:hypothetical protein